MASRSLRSLGSLLCFVITCFASTALAESTIWKVQNHEHSFYLAGSCHALRLSDYPLPAEFEAAYADSDVLVFETDLDGMRSKENQMLLASKGMLEKGRTIKDLVSEKVYRKYSEYCQSRKLPQAALDRFKPWMLAITLSAMEMQRGGVNLEAGMDLYFNEKAKKDGKARKGLVPVKEHIEIISSLDTALNETIMLNLMDELPKVVPLITEMLDAWKTGDEATLDKLFCAELREKYPELYSAFLIDRNRKWIPLIEGMMQEKNRTMIIVGSGHLVGENSVVDLLRQKGYQVDKFILTQSQADTSNDPSTSTSSP